MENFDAPAGSADNAIPKIIANNLQIENILGRGGMGTVYRATHLTLDRVVAVKIINSDVAANTDISQRFAREARLMAKLRHPRAAMIYDSGTLPDGRLFIVMEYVEGITLAEVLQKEGRLPFQKAVDIAVSICDVLGEAHSLGIIHRDLKPANIMLNNQGVFVLDFGIAKMLNADNAESMKLSMTGGGALIGTPYYMSPEQCLGNPVEARSDLYSLGALLFEMLSGRPPFDEDTFSAVIIKHAMVEAPKLEEFCRDIPPALCNVVNSLLSKNPDERPASAAVTKSLLEASVSGQTSPAINFTTQTNVSAAPANQSAPAALTQQLSSQTSPQIPKPSMELPSAALSSVPRAGNRSRNIGILAGAALLLLLVAGISIGAFFFIKSRAGANLANTSSNQTSNAYTNSSSNMEHTMHNMPMGEDFTKKTDDDKANPISAQILSTEEADKVITNITRTTEHHADGMQIIKTPKDTALVCIHNKIDLGQTHIFAVERPNLTSPWEITARISLDIPEFRSPNWTFEPQDVDGDGFEEVIFSGVNADSTAHRVLIYVPRTRQNYTILLVKDASGKTVSTTLSPNAQTVNAAAIRKTLEQSVGAR
jgi:serine/threonine protein kinase